MRPSSRNTNASTSKAKPIETAPRGAEQPVLLFCPDQSRWQTEEWWTADRPRWVAVMDASIDLEPTHWAPLPASPA